MQIRSTFINTTSDIGSTGGFAAQIDWALIYLSLTLATTLLCTLLIVYRILRLASGVSSYGKIVEIVIESSAMYSLTLIGVPGPGGKESRSCLLRRYDHGIYQGEASVHVLPSVEKLNLAYCGRSSPLRFSSDASQWVPNQTPAVRR